MMALDDVLHNSQPQTRSALFTGTPLFLTIKALKYSFESLGRNARAVIATDQQIDQLVYELYGLTPEEIALVEAA